MSWIEKFSKVPKNLIFHYTSIEGLIGIFREKNLWATNILHLNDQEELLGARDMFCDSLRSLKERIKLPLEPAIRSRDFKPDPKSFFFDMFDNYLKMAGDFNIFVCSFTEAKDLLSQWRGYCPSGYGFSIGFMYDGLKEHIDRQKFILAKCIYDEKEQKRKIDEYIRINIEPELNKSLRLGEVKDKVIDLMLDVLPVFTIFKNKNFREEKEWRLISPIINLYQNKKIHFRAGKTVIIPYYEFELARGVQNLPIKSIIIGPTANRKESFSSVDAILTKEGMDKQIHISHSQIPYREI